MISSAPSARSWCRDTLTEETWRFPLPVPLLDRLDGLLQAPPALRPTTVRLPEEMRFGCRELLEPIARALEDGPGLVVVEAPPREHDDRQLVLLYWLVGQALGSPVAQNVEGVVLYDVRDTGQDVRRGARFSITNAESSFHTDASFWDEVVDYVGLLCLRPSRAGGLSQVVNGVTVLQQLSLRHPEAIDGLSRPFHVDRRGGARPGESPTALFPVLTQTGPAEVMFRYLRYWIESGHARVGQPLTSEQTKALDALDSVLADPALRVEFSMRRGEMFFVNNRRVLHNRTAFEDFTEPERRRHLVRLWLARSIT
jgi:alpha-ketoglutarate-dependent taurine dioxygenase